jgi:hypothetical protein
VAGVGGLELRNVVANYPFETLCRFAAKQPNSGHGDHSRLSCSAGDTQLGTELCRDLQEAFCTGVGRVAEKARIGRDLFSIRRSSAGGKASNTIAQFALDFPRKESVCGEDARRACPACSSYPASADGPPL